MISPSESAEAMVAKMVADPTGNEQWKAGQEAAGAQGAAGAAINAKVLRHEAPTDMAHLMHLTYGLNQYPAYLQKWPLESVDRAIELLEQELAKARSARSALEARAAYVAGYEPLHPELRAPTPELVLTPAAARAARVGVDLSADEFFEAIDLRQEAEGVYSFAVMAPAICDKLRAEFANYAQYRDKWTADNGDAPPGATRERLQLVDCGLDALEQFLFDNVGKPLAKLLFGSAGSRDDSLGDLDAVHAYTIGYGVDANKKRNVTRRALVPHVDDSEVTLNICLSDSFEGGGLRFHGKRHPEKTTLAYDLPSPNEATYQHKFARAVIHLGGHFHEVLDVTKGERHVLIMWMRSWGNYRASHCPCCLKFRRLFCVCSPEWN